LLTQGKVAPGLTFHGQGHMPGTRLKEAGARDQQIADNPGQKSPSRARLYSEGVRAPEETPGVVLKIDDARDRP